MIEIHYAIVGSSGSPLDNGSGSERFKNAIELIAWLKRRTEAGKVVVIDRVED